MATSMGMPRVGATFTASTPPAKTMLKRWAMGQVLAIDIDHPRLDLL
jgi:hypothetical protein